MKNRQEDIRRIKKVCSLVVCGIGAWLAFSGCSPKESEVLWSTEAAESAKIQGQEVTQVSEAEQTEEALTAYATVESTEKVQYIYVHVCGAVRNPSVVELATGSRVADALEAAGGFAEDACTDYVNLAAEVQDGQQLYFPTQEEVNGLELSQGDGRLAWTQEIASGGNAESSDGKVNINTASESELCTLPGIGTARAQAIIAYRQENGAFAEIADIMKVSGIKTSAYEKIQDKITVH